MGCIAIDLFFQRTLFLDMKSKKMHKKYSGSDGSCRRSLSGKPLTKIKLHSHFISTRPPRTTDPHFNERQKWNKIVLLP